MNFNVGDTLVSTERIWSKDLQRTIKKDTKIQIKHLDDFLTLPSPTKWKKINEKV